MSAITVNQNKEQEFVENHLLAWQPAAQGIQRKVMASDEKLMLVKVAFEKGAIGAVHQHPHVQMSSVESGVFEIEINGKKKILKAGDAFYVPSNVWHGAVCVEAGVLIDAFSPMRADFL